MLNKNQNQYQQYNQGVQYYQQQQYIPQQENNQNPQHYMPMQLNYQYPSNQNNQQYDFQQQNMEKNEIFQGNNITFQNGGAKNQQNSQLIPQYDPQKYEQLSNSALDIEIKKNEAQIQLLKQENDQLNEEIHKFNSHQIQQQNQQFQQALLNSPQPIFINNSSLIIDDKPEIAYCTTPIFKRNKDYQAGSISTYGLSVLLQKIHTHLSLDYSAIDIMGKTNLFDKSFVEREVIEKLHSKNKLFSRFTLENSKQVYCCNYFHKMLNKYSKNLCIGLSIWIFVLSLIYIIGQVMAKYFHLLNILAQISGLLYMSTQILIVYLGMRKCSLAYFQAAQIMSMINIFIQFGVTSMSMSLLGGESGFQIQPGFVLIFIFNVLNMFLQMFLLAVYPSLVQSLKRLLAVILQIPSTELTS